ncbi:Carnitine O-palmitoyltransferase 1, liver, partial [Lamellibrachia satsuma]
MSTRRERDLWRHSQRRTARNGQGVRRQHFQSGLNKDSLDILESALFHVVLDNKCFKTWSERGKYMLHGNGASLWFDKSFNLLVFSDGRYGLNAEHSWADAPTMSYVSEFNLTNEQLLRRTWLLFLHDPPCLLLQLFLHDLLYRPLQLLLLHDPLCRQLQLLFQDPLCRPRQLLLHNPLCRPLQLLLHVPMVLMDLFDADGYCQPILDITQSGIRQPIRLVWDMSSDLEIKVDRALTISQQNNDDLDFCLQEFSAYGKGFIKKCKVSPDAYIQLALQLAYYRDADRFVLTYEASMTRLFLHGRTEAVRSLTQESCNFVQSMSDENATNEERIRLLRVACERHQSLYRDAMTGKGVDRHLLGLYVVSKSLGL